MRGRQVNSLSDLFAGDDNMSNLSQLFLVFCLALSGCSIAASEGKIGRSEHSRFILLGEFISDEEALKYANQYNGAVLFSPSAGFIAGATTKALTATLGPSSFMKGVMNEFRSMSNSSKDWEVIVPEIAKRYFLVTLKNMDDHSVTNAHGRIIIPESSYNREIDEEVVRVFGYDFEVVYGQ